MPVQPPDPAQLAAVAAQYGLGLDEADLASFSPVVEGAAPVVFGLITDAVGEDDRGLQLSFLIALPSLVAAAWLLRVAGRSYDADRAAVLHADHSHGDD